MFEAMLVGWRAQQVSRSLSPGTVQAREKAVRRFHVHSNEWPWLWTAAMAEEWAVDLRLVRKVSHSTARSLQGAVRQFCWFLTDPRYVWVADCQALFGTHPVQVFHEENSPAHVASVESRPAKRAFTLEELEAFFDHADDQAERARALGRKGWLPAFRDSVVFKTAYGWGLRRNEVRMLDVGDFGVNPKAPEFGRYGVCYVRQGDARLPSPTPRGPDRLGLDHRGPRRVGTVRGQFPLADGPALFPSERGQRVGLSAMNRTFAAYRRAVGLDEALDFHSLRRSYVTHLVEAGFDTTFLQQQVGHEHASTTSLYTFVSADYRTRVLRQALDKTLAQALGPAPAPVPPDPATRTTP